MTFKPVALGFRIELKLKNVAFHGRRKTGEYAEKDSNGPKRFWLFGKEILKIGGSVRQVYHPFVPSVD